MDATVVLTSSGSGSDSSGLDFSNTITNISTYLNNNYSDYTWYQDDECSTKMISNEIPINMQGVLFPEADINQAIVNTEVASTYGGCVPIAMMGVLDYFARYLGYDEIIDDPTNSTQRILLAEEVLEEVTTYEVGDVGDKSTLTFPGDYVSAFNNLIKYYGLENHIVANYNGSVLGGNNKEEYLEIIEEYIPKGVPVTMYMGLNTGEGAFAEHYVNIYAYENWIGCHNTTGETIEKNFLKARINGPANNDGWDLDRYFADSEILNNAMCGLIYYDVNYDNDRLVNVSDFSEELSTLSDYGNINTTIDSSNYSFYLQGANCAYINNYLSLCSNTSSGGVSYLQFNLTYNYLKELKFKVGAWSNMELFSNDKILIKYKNSSGLWVNHIEISTNDIGVDRTSLNEFKVLFPEYVKEIRIELNVNGPVSGTNNGRIVIDNLSFSFNDIDHYHTYNSYQPLNANYHKCICSCGEYIQGQHVWNTTSIMGIGDQFNPNYIPVYYCLICGYETTKPPIGI